MNVWIVYDSKYGNNKRLAETLAGQFKENNTVHVHYAKEIAPAAVIEGGVDVLLIGGPLRLGRVSFTMKQWAAKVAKLLRQKGLAVRKAAIWGTHIQDPPNATPKYTWDAIKLQWKAILGGIPAEKRLGDMMSSRDAGTMPNVRVSVMVSVATCNTSRRAPASPRGPVRVPRTSASGLLTRTGARNF